MRAHCKYLNLADTPAELLSQGNASNSDGNVWCGRTSGSIIHNYYRRIFGGGGPIKNQVDRLPYDLVYPSGRSAAAGFYLDEPIRTLIGEGAFAGTYDPPEGGAPLSWGWHPLYTQQDEADGKPVEDCLKKLLDNLDNNNPAMFASCISKLGERTTKKGVASHFVVISGYKHDDAGALWLQITCPAASYATMQLIHGSVAGGAWLAGTTPEEACKDFLTIDWKADYVSAREHVVTPPRPGHGCRYWVKVSALLQNHPGLANPRDNLDLGSMRKPGARRYVCDNYHNPGFSVLLPNTTVRTDPKYAVTDLAISWPVELGKVTQKGAATTVPTTGKEEPPTPVQWSGWVDTAAPYPVGGGLTWHNGVHLSEASAADGSIYSVGPGEVVLARFAKEKYAAGHFTRDESEDPSSGFVLIRHRFDPAVRTLADLPPLGKAPDASLKELFLLYMHLAPISTYVEADPEQPKVKIANARSPHWLRPLLPGRLPRYRGLLPAETPLTHSVIASVSDAADARFTALPTAPAKLMREHGFKESPLTVDDHPSAKVVVGGAPHIAIPATPTPLPDHGLALIATRASAPLGYYNVLADQVIEVDAEVPAYAAIGTRRAAGGQTDEVDVLRTASGDCWVRTKCYSRPGFLHSDVAQGVQVQGGVLSVPGGSVKLTAESGTKPLGERMLTSDDTRLLFPCKKSGGKASVQFHPELAPVLRVPRATLPEWEAALGAGGTPAGTVADLCFFNPLTEAVIDGLVPVNPAARVDAEITADHKRRTLQVVLERGGDVFVKAHGVAARVDAAPKAAKHETTTVLFFDQRVSAAKLFLDTFEAKPGQTSSREFTAESAMLSNDLSDETILAFRLLETASTGKVLAARFWPDLAPCVKVAESVVADWNQQLAARSAYAEKARGRLTGGLSRLVGVDLSAKGWSLDDKGCVTRGADADAAELGSPAKDGDTYRIVPSAGDVAPHNWSVTGSVSAVPLGLVVGHEGLAHAALFEVIDSVPQGSQRDNRPDIDAARADNEKRWKEVTATHAAGTILSFLEKPVAVSRECVGRFDADGPSGASMHVELFSKDNLFPGNDGQDEKLVRIAKTPWFLLRDDDALDAYTPDFVARLRKALRDAQLGVPLKEGALAEADRYHCIIKPSEWSKFCTDNGDSLSFVVAAHTSEWHPEHEKILDEANRRGAHLPDEEVTWAKDEIKRLAFLDKLYESNERLFFYHPLRFLEWMMTGVDLTVDGAANPKAKMRTGGVDLTPDPSSKILRHRMTVGSEKGRTSDYIALGEGIKSQHPNIPVSIVRGHVARVRVVNPTLACLPDDKKLTRHLLADAGHLKEGKRVQTFAISVSYNVEGPSRITGKLAGSGFTLSDVRAPKEATVEKTATGFTVRWAPAPFAKAFGSPETVEVAVDVLAGDTVDAKAQLEVSAEGGDLVGTPSVKGAEIVTRVLRRKHEGADVEQLQRYLTKIRSARGVCFPAEGTGEPLLDGSYGSGLAAALWMFLYTCASDIIDPLALNQIPYVDDKDKPGNATLDQLQKSSDGAQAARCSSKQCKQFPIVDQPLLREIVKRLDQVPLGSVFSVDPHLWSGDGTEATMSLTARSAILPTGDAITIRVQVHGLERLTRSLPVRIEVPGGSAYAVAPGQANKVLSAQNTTFTVRLESSGKITCKASDNLVGIRASDSNVLVGALQLAGTRDRYVKDMRDGVPQRDALILQYWLNAIDHPVFCGTSAKPVALDGTWGETERLSFQRFATSQSAKSYVEAVVALGRVIPVADRGAVG